MKKRPARNTTCISVFALALMALPLPAQDIPTMARALEGETPWGPVVQSVTVDEATVTLSAEVTSIHGPFSTLSEARRDYAMVLAGTAACDSPEVLALLEAGASVSYDMLDETGASIEVWDLGSCPQIYAQDAARAYAELLDTLIGEPLAGFAVIHAYRRSLNETRVFLELIHEDVPENPRAANEAQKEALARAALMFLCSGEGMDYYFSVGARLLIELTTADAPQERYAMIYARTCDDYSIFS